MKDRFDLEQEIMQCWSVTDDIKLLREQLFDPEDEMSIDDIDNFLLGVQTIYHAKFDRLFKTFEDCIKQKEFKEQ